MREIVGGVVRRRDHVPCREIKNHEIFFSVCLLVIYARENFSLYGIVCHMLCMLQLEDSARDLWQ